MSDERRKEQRLTGPFEGSWRGASGGLSACRVSDVSTGGAFVQSLASPSPGEETVVTVHLSGDVSITMKGRVVYSDAGMGFAIKFDQLDPDLAERLKAMIGNRAGV